MANIRKRYYSIPLGAFTDVDVNQTSGDSVNTNNIGGYYNTETIRLIPHGADVTSTGIANIVADLLYNDIQIEAQSNQLGYIVSEGVFRDTLDEFEVDNIYDFITSGLPDPHIGFRLKKGQLKIQNEVIRTVTDSPDYYLLGVDKNIPDISINSGYRRDTIQYSFLTDSFVYVAGTDVEVRPPIDTQLSRVDPTHYVLYSILLKKDSSSDPTLFYDIDQVWEYTGILSANNQIVRAELHKGYDGLYSVHDGQKIHLRSFDDNLLTWSYGQSSQARPTLGGYYIPDVFDRTQLPQNYDPLNGSSLVNIPFDVSYIANNFLGISSVKLSRISIGVKNSTYEIGDEGIGIQLVTANNIFEDPIPVSSFTHNSSSFTATIASAGINFSAHSIVAGSDFILITSGPGQYQVAKIISIASGGDSIYVTGLTKPISTLSYFQIFRAATETNVGGEVVKTNVELTTDVLTGTYGRFGNDNQWSKVGFVYDSLTAPTINTGKWYFIKIKAVNNPSSPATWGQLSFITVENPFPAISGDNGKKSAFYEIHYESLTGLYPSGDFLIEDEFGDIGSEVLDRELSPHFRPVKYNLLARGLDYIDPSIETMMEIDDVYVDVRCGKIKFKTGYEPRRLYITYYKRDVIDGDTTGNQIKFFNVKENPFKNNIQNKIIEIDNRFEKGTSFKKPVENNGIIPLSDKNDLYNGVADIADSHIVQMVDGSDSDLFDKEEENNIIGINRHYSDEIVIYDENKIYVKNKLLKAPEANVRSGITISGCQSAIFKPIISSKDEHIHLLTNRLVDENNFKKKRFNTGLSELSYHIDNDVSLRDETNNRGVTGRFNELIGLPFDTNIIFKAALRKETIESETYPFHSNSIRHIKQRESIKNIDEQLKNVNDYSGNTVSEKYFTDYRFDYDHGNTRKLNILTPYSEYGDRSQFEFIDGVTVPINVENDITFNIVKLNNSHFAYIYNDPNVSANKMAVKIFKASKSPSAKDYVEFDTIAPESFTEDFIRTDSFVSENQVIKIDVIKISESRFAVLYVESVSFVYTLKLSIFEFDTTGVTPVLKQIVHDRIVDSNINNDLFFGGAYSRGKIAIAWKKDSSNSNYIIYDVEANAFTAPTTFFNVFLTEKPKVSAFSREHFVILYSFDGGLHLKQIDLSGNTVFFGASSYLEISNNNIPNGFNSDIIEVESTNNLAIIYSEQEVIGPNSYVKTKISIVDEWTRSISKTSVIQDNKFIVQRDIDYKIISLNDESFIVRYISWDNKIITYRVFSNNLEEYQFNHTHSFVNNQFATNIRMNDYSFIEISLVSNTTVTCREFEFRPDFDKYRRTMSEPFFDGPVSNIGYFVPQGIDSARIDVFTTVITYIANGRPYLDVIDSGDPKNIKSLLTAPLLLKNTGGHFNRTSVALIKKTSGQILVGVVYQRTGEDAKFRIIDLTSYASPNINFIASPGNETDITNSTSTDPSFFANTQIIYDGYNKIYCAYINSSTNRLALNSIDITSPAAPVFAATPDIEMATPSDPGDEINANNILILEMERANNDNAVSELLSFYVFAGVRTIGLSTSYDVRMIKVNISTGIPNIVFENAGSPLIIENRRLSDFPISAIRASSEIVYLGYIEYGTSDSFLASIGNASTNIPTSFVLNSSPYISGVNSINLLPVIDTDQIFNITYHISNRIEMDTVGNDLLPSSDYMTSNPIVIDDIVGTVEHRSIYIRGNYHINIYVETKRANIQEYNNHPVLYNLSDPIDGVNVGLAGQWWVNINTLDIFEFDGVSSWTFPTGNPKVKKGMALVSEEVFPLRKDFKNKIEILNVDGVYKAYNHSILKISGLRFDNKVIRPFEFFRSNNGDIEISKIDTLRGIASNTINKSSMSVVGFTKDSFSIVYHPFDVQSNNEIYIRKYKIVEDRIFADSDVVVLKSFTSSEPGDITCHATIAKQSNISTDTRIFVIYVDRSLTGSTIHKFITTPSGSILPETDSEILVKSPKYDISQIVYNNFVGSNSYSLTIKNNPNLSGVSVGDEFKIFYPSNPNPNFASGSTPYVITAIDKNNGIITFDVSGLTGNDQLYEAGIVSFETESDFSILAIRTLDTGKIAIYYRDVIFNNEAISIIDNDGITSLHDGEPFNLLQYIDFDTYVYGKSSMDSSGIVVSNYMTASGDLGFIQFGPEGRLIGTIQIKGKQLLEPIMEHEANLDMEPVVLRQFIDYMDNFTFMKQFAINDIVTIGAGGIYFVTTKTSHVNMYELTNPTDYFEIIYGSGSTPKVTSFYAPNNLTSTKDTLNSINVYYDVTEDALAIQNTTASTVSFIMIKQEIA